MWQRLVWTAAGISARMMTAALGRGTAGFKCPIIMNGDEMHV